MPRSGQRTQHVRLVAVAWLLVVGLTGILAVARAQAAAREHACCRTAPVRAEAPPAPCPSLLPLACCDASVLPATAHHAFDLGDPALAGATLAPEPSRACAPWRHANAAASPRASPLQLSVVLRL
jgi:hypothetical protein